jgi:hypothetical protein
MKLAGINSEGKLQDIKVAADGSILTVSGSLYGAECITDTAVHTAANMYIALQFIDDTVIEQFTTETGATITGNNLTGIIIPSGNTIYGRFKTIKLTSGKVFAYKGV